MSSYEYTVIPAPARGEKSRGAKAGIERFAATLGDVLNQMAADGWEYVRAEVLPAEERSGLTSRTTVYHNLLVFRRPTAAQPLRVEAATATRPAAADAAPVMTAEPAPAPVASLPEETRSAVDLPADAPVRAPFSQPMRPTARPTQSRNAEPPLKAPELVGPPGPRLGPASR